ncbi:retinal rod rhodopsin-sensitive cGMP 3',5'-cyclic phosphodiesterase subunit gamma isoform X1 [Notamacropus eugenii]|uniref:retinal rod rhodopsin-sensitive cGMP 3',5'-cyclic phosphodiesterase subunit gamma isoform X1 n=1 Tax=Notamacropus eugenii TaxID=9315 RepID=UPI003B67A700
MLLLRSASGRRRLGPAAVSSAPFVQLFKSGFLDNKLFYVTFNISQEFAMPAGEKESWNSRETRNLTQFWRTSLKTGETVPRSGNKINSRVQYLAQGERAESKAFLFGKLLEKLESRNEANTTQYTIISSKWIHDLDLKGHRVNKLEEQKGDIFNLWMGRVFVQTGSRTSQIIQMKI